jgi:hypothetical protein
MVGARGFTSRFLRYALRVIVANAPMIKTAPGSFVNLLIRFQIPHISFKLLLLSSDERQKGI